MADGGEEGSAQDDVSFLRTGDIVCLTCISSHKEPGVGTSERVCLAAEGFGNRVCMLENVSERNNPPDISLCMFYIDQALSVRALQEMMSSEGQEKGGGGGGHRTLLYGHAVKLKHAQSDMYLACLSTCSSSDKLSFDVGLQESQEGESSWWTIHPASKQRSEGEKVRVSDDVILVSVATERYLHFMATEHRDMVIASFHQTLWAITPMSTGAVRLRNHDTVFGNDVLRFMHGNDECLTIPEQWSEHPQHNMIIYEGGGAIHQARSLWRMEMVRQKWHGAMVGWEQVFRIRHITTGRFLAITSDHQICLLHRDKADYESTAFIMMPQKDTKRQGIDEKEEEGMGLPILVYTETTVFIQHLETQLWFSYQTLEVQKKGVGKVEEKKAIAAEEGHMDDCFQFNRAQEEESKSARVIRKCSSVLNKFLKKLDDVVTTQQGLNGLQTEGNDSSSWLRVDLAEVLKLMEDLIAYFEQPDDAEIEFEDRQRLLRGLRNRQSLFQQEGVLNMILDTIDQFSQMESQANFATLIGESNQKNWEEISTYLYLLVAAMIKSNHSNCAQFASAQRLDWLFGRLANPQSAEGILDVLYCVLTESPEALNMISEEHIKAVIGLLEKVGRDPKVLDVLCSLCSGNGVAVRCSQNLICQHLLPSRDLLLQSGMQDQKASCMPNILVGVVENSAMFLKWYFEAEIEHVEQMTSIQPMLRVGWATNSGFVPYPGSGDKWGSLASGDDMFSYTFDGRQMWVGGNGKTVGTRALQKGDIIGCALDLSRPEITFSLNGNKMDGSFRDFNLDGFFFPVMSLSAKASCRFILGGTHGKLKYGPGPSYSAIFEAAHGEVTVQPCFKFGDVPKALIGGPKIFNERAFVPEPIDISDALLPQHVLTLHERLAENMHELWAMNKIQNGWFWGDRRSESRKTHPCLTSYDRLPPAEKNYNLNLAMDTLKTIVSLGYHIIQDKPPQRMKTLKLNNNFAMPNGYKPAPLDTREFQHTDDRTTHLVEALAKNTHNIWSKEKISRTWTYGFNEDPIMKRSPHLVPYEQVDTRIKQANRDTASETVRTILAYGYLIEPPSAEADEGHTKETEALSQESRTYRAQRTYAVTSGKWYYECEILSTGYMKIGWMDIAARPDSDLGSDDLSFGVDGYLCYKWHQGHEPYGKQWNTGDVIGCFLDLNDKTISFSLNGELLLDYSGAEMAFDNILVADGFVPAYTLAAGQTVRLNFGQNSNSLKYFTTCGLQDGYEPFCVNMYRQLPLWYSKELATFENVADESRLEVTRIPASETNPPCLRVCHKNLSGEKASLELLRLSLPVKCHSTFMKNKDRNGIREQLKELSNDEEEEDSKVMAAAAADVEVDPDTAGKRRGKFTKTQSLDQPDKGGKGSSPLKQRQSRLGVLKEYGLWTSFDETGKNSPKSLTITKLKQAYDNFAQGDQAGKSQSADKKEHSTSEHDLLSADGDMSQASGKRNPLKMLSKVGQKVRDANAHRAAKKIDEKPKGRQRSTETANRIDGISPRSGAASRHLAPSAEEEAARALAAEKAARAAARKKALLNPVESHPAGSGPSDDAFALGEMIDQVDEYYYGVRLFAGQDPSHVWIGWVAPYFHYHGQSFTETNVRKVTYHETDRKGGEYEKSTMRSCYMVNAAELQNAVGGEAGGSKVSGLLIGCLIDTSTGDIGFMANGKETEYKFKVEPNTMLYPAVFVEPSSKEMLQFELGRIKYTLPLSSALLKSTNKSIHGICPPRLKLQTLEKYHWARVPNEILRINALKLSDVRGWSVLCDDSVRMLVIYVPERDACLDVLELIEHTDYLKFHTQTLELYGALCAHSNFPIAHQLCHHVNEEQLMYGIQNEYMAGTVRCGFYDLLIALHLDCHTEARKNTRTEFVIPLTDNLRQKNCFSDESLGVFPHVLGEGNTIRPVMAYQDVEIRFNREIEKNLKAPVFNFEAVKQFAIESFASATHRAVMNSRDLIGGDNYTLFRPLLRLLDHLLVIGLMTDDDLKNIFIVLDPARFDMDYESGTTQKGLVDVTLAEGVKLEFCHIIDSLIDVQIRHRMESLVAFSETFTEQLQADQNKRYLDIKQTDYSPAEAARKTKEFRCPPTEQMSRLLDFRNVKAVQFDEDDTDDVCPMSENLQEQMLNFHQQMIKCIGVPKPDESAADLAEESNDDEGWLDRLAAAVVRVPPPVEIVVDDTMTKGEEHFRQMVIKNVANWAREGFIENTELVREMFRVLLRVYNGVNEICAGIERTYVIHERNIRDLESFLIYLGKIRALIPVQTEPLEEDIIRFSLWKLMNNNVFFQHPDLIRLLSVHENVMTVMTSVLERSVPITSDEEGGDDAITEETRETSAMVVPCCKFLCYFCRSSSQNQKAMFEHMPFLLDNASMMLVKPSLRGSVPLDVAACSFKDNNELSLALKEEELDKLCVYLSRCGLQSNSDLVAKGYPDLGWDPVEGERYLDFLRYCVWVNGESIEDNANLVIRLLIRRPECLGPALKGEGEGLLSAFKQAISMSEQIASGLESGNARGKGGKQAFLGDTGRYPTQEEEGGDYIDMGGAVLQFYSTLVDLLGKCAPEPATISAGKGESLRARAILKSLISLEDLEAILALKFTIPNVSAMEVNLEMPAGLLPQHKQPILLFLERVYGIETQDKFFLLLESSFLPDLRTVGMLDAPKARDCDIALSLNRYLCNALLPLMTAHALFFAEAEHQATLMDAILHAVYRISKMPSLTNNQRVAVSEFLISMTRELSPPMMLRLLRQVVVDIPALTEFAIVPLKIMTLHYDRTSKYYGQGSNEGTASEEEKRLSMTLFTAIFDSLGRRAYDPELFGRALPCLTTIACALSPDYTLSQASEDEQLPEQGHDDGVWSPTPVDISEVEMEEDTQGIIEHFAEHFHDSWASVKIAKGWAYKNVYKRDKLTHPRLMPFNMLKEFEKGFYIERCAENVRGLLAWGYEFELVDPEAASREHINQSGTTIRSYRPRPIDLSNMSLSKDLIALAEKMAENSHQIWARRALDDLSARGGSMLMTIVPWDLLTDWERRKYRFMSQEVLKFFQFYGYRIYKPEESKKKKNELDLVRGAGVERRFAYSLLEKLLHYLDNAAFMMKPTKPSSNFSRRNSFRQSTRDVKFFSKVVLPLMQAYFSAHQIYFLTSSGVSTTGVASNKEKEMVASLFCRLFFFIRKKNHAFGCDAKVTIQCLQCLVRAMDCRSLVKMNSDLIRTSLLQFFNMSADDLSATVKDLKNVGQYSAIRGANLKSWTCLEFAHQVLLPVLTALYNHLARNNFGIDLIVDDIQIACYKILDNLYSLTKLVSTVKSRKQVFDELDKHRPQLGHCLSAFSRAFPVAFLEPEFNPNNKFSVLSKFEDSSMQAQDMLLNLSQNVPKLEDMLGGLEAIADSSGMYVDSATTFDVDLPILCSYMSYWYNFGPEGSNKGDSNKQLTSIVSDHNNRCFFSLLKLVKCHMSVLEATWLCRVSGFATQIIQYVTADPLPDLIQPLSESLRKSADHAYKEEDRLRTHPDDSDEGAVAETHATLVRDIYSFFPLLIKYTDLHRAQWLKNPTSDAEITYENVAKVFKVWSTSQHFKREEMNFMSQYGETDGGGGEVKSGKAAIAERKKKRREGKGQGHKENKSVVVACLKRLLPVGLNVFGGRELDIVHVSKERYLQNTIEDKVKEAIAGFLAIPVKTDPTDANTWQRKLYEKIGKTAMRGADDMSEAEVIEKISSMGQVLSILHTVEHPSMAAGALQKVVTIQRKRAVVACFRAIPLYMFERHRCINVYLKSYSSCWLAFANLGQDQLIADLCPDAEDSTTVKDEDDGHDKMIKPDALSQLIQVFSRIATSETRGSVNIFDDHLLIVMEEVMAKSIHVVDEDDGEERGPAQQELEKNTLRDEQFRLFNRGAATMVLQYIAACGGEPNQMVANTMEMGIKLISGGNVEIQTAMLLYLQDKKEARFFTSIAGLMNKCSVLNLEIFERQVKAEGLGMGAELAIGENQNLNDVDFVCSLFRFLQLTCEGHNNEFQNYLRTQPGNPSSLNLVTASVDYLLRIQESIMDFYWHYSSKGQIDQRGKEQFLKALQVCSQVFNTLTEVTQGPCILNQMTLANSRLWDAINGFFFLFAQMMDKLSKDSTQLELLREFLNLQKDMIVLMLSMLEGNILNGAIGKQMVDTLVESQSNLETILKFFDMFLKLKDLTSSSAFQEFDENKDGWISSKEFLRAMENQKMYSIEEINYLMMCTDINNDGKVDYMEFTERFHNPAREIGFNMAVLITNLNEHTLGDRRLEEITAKANNVLEYFDTSLGRIEITGAVKKVEKVYFEVQEDWLEQWNKPQIKDSKREFIHSIIAEGGDDKSRLEAFVDFCEDCIYEMKHAQTISPETTSESKIERAKLLRDNFVAALSFGQSDAENPGLLSRVADGIKSTATGTVNFFKPSQLKSNGERLLSLIRQMTYGEMIIKTAKAGFKASSNVFWFFVLFFGTILRFIYYLFKGPEDEEATSQSVMHDSTSGVHARGLLTRESTKYSETHLDPHMTHDASFDPGLNASQYEDIAASTHTPHFTSEDVVASGSKHPTPQPSLDADAAAATGVLPSMEQRSEAPAADTATAAGKTPSKPGSVAYGAGSHAQAPVGPPFSPPVSDAGEPIYEPKIAEGSGQKEGSTILFWLARNFYTLRSVCSILAIMINVILLFYRVDIEEPDGSGSDEDGSGGLADLISGSGAGDDDEPIETVLIPEQWWFLVTICYVISTIHCIISLFVVIAYYQLKVPLLIFKREKLISRQLLEGKWITDTEYEDDESFFHWHSKWDRLVISTGSFPNLYWDTFVRKKAGQKYSDEIDPESMTKLLALDQEVTEEKVDWRYTGWKTGTIVMDQQLIYLVVYTIGSWIGIQYPFVYAFHVLDVVVSNPMLQTILRAITHNLTQLLLTILMTLVVVYIYTVLAFNFFRKFYVNEEEGEEPDRKCHDMLTCFIFHFYAGVRAGGGIGDELDAPFGDELMYPRMVFDISFFFFIIVILLAIMQGLIIDAFGELRDQLESVKENLENNCFICGLSKEFFDKYPRGFEKHTEKEHNLANYLFFIMHLLNKDETEYTGQETYVRNMYDERCFEFFPLGEAFVKQYEEELMANL